jgi:hypothetical protein
LSDILFVPLIRATRFWQNRVMFVLATLVVRQVALTLPEVHPVVRPTLSRMVPSTGVAVSLITRKVGFVLCIVRDPVPVVRTIRAPPESTSL